MKAINAVSYLLIGLLGVTGFVFSLVWMRKQNRRRIIWLTVVLVCVCALVLFADNLEKVRALETISRHMDAVLRGF